ncbi:GTP 3',8-cyclase MoaA [Arenimonas terrae]|jgi:cyclic pyranopterin phosphate synthase|uniref:GTP 3',8-cyclase n=1 Tax=Arenimonas terrae TaxID=2546226 RepID=A0A5C4RWL5_9GAMM|nr:GTP 3',8-cyclase MoaA [Arenimonas terrae]TNJ35087.1 GTP 3',8-cyclase MoaA [Arenimonas terrae]
MSAYPSTGLPRDRLGRPLRDLRVSVIETCNFRCPYCMPEGLTPEETALDRARRLDFDEIETAVRAFARLGVSKLRLTGGEPLLRKGLPELVARLARIPGIDDLALTTNGSLLAGQARALREAGLHRLTVSVDSLDPAGFSAMSGGRGDLGDVLAGLAAAESAGFRSIKINSVIQRGVNEDQALALAGRFRGTPHVPRFIEYMDVGTCNGWRRENVVPSAELRDRIAGRWPLRALTPTYRGEVASRYAYADGQGEVGFVSSVSEPFCGDCHRARLSADGQLYTCLFAARGQPLRERIAEGEDALAAHLSGLWRLRGDRYSEERAKVPADRKKIEMFYIGG